jgi:hypothetical protein
MAKTEVDISRAYEAHGVVFNGESGDELVGDCPFTGKSDKFYLNKVKGVWDSKTFGRSGNLHTFLDLRAKQYEEAMTPTLRAALAKHRGLPVAALDGWGIGWTGTQYAFPVYTAQKRCVDIRLYKLGGRMMSTPGATTGLFGAQLLPNALPDESIYICEGEWDAIAWRYVREEAGYSGVVVGVPGANTFKQEWGPWFAKRNTHVLYDHDEPGIQGDQKVFKRISNYTRTLRFLHWPVDLAPGYDVRDHVTTSLAEGKKPKQIVDWVEDRIKAFPRVVPEDVTKSGDTPVDGETNTSGPAVLASGRTSKWLKPPTFEDLEGVFRKWLFLDDTNALRVMLATVISQALDGPPIWVFLVAPPGGSKTEHLNSLIDVPIVYMTSSLTPHSLISGANWKDGADPSLIPKLHNRVMVIKDFTAILGMRDSDKEEIFAILRDAYDGRCGKVFGNGVERSYESRFTVLGAVTPRIYDLSGNHASLGERFLKFGIGSNLHHASEDEIIRRAIRNINRATQMQEELADATSAFLTRTVDTSRVPALDEALETKLINLGKFGARMRGTVSRDTYKNDIITSRPSAEIGSRLGVQLAKLAKALAMVHGRHRVSVADYTMVKKVMLDTIPQRGEDVLREMLRLCPTPTTTMTAQTISEITHYPRATVARLLQDMLILGIVERKAHGMSGEYKHEWTVAPYIRNCVQKSGLYSTEEEVARKPIFSFRVRRARKRAPKRHTGAA